MLYFDSVVCEKFPEKTNFALLRLNCLVLGVKKLNELSGFFHYRKLFTLILHQLLCSDYFFDGSFHLFSIHLIA